YALGTAESPIGFTGAITETGWWAGIEGVGRAAITLRHCEISYGGCTTSNNLAASLVIRWGTDGVPSANIQNCEIHHSGLKGVHFDFYNLNVNVPPLFHYNSLHDNTQEAVTNFNAPPLDARDNYWGDPSGPYHPTQNPGGLGEAVGDNILFYPWQNVPVSGEVPGEMLVSTGSPNRFSPGEKVDYAVQYLNMMTTTVENGMLLVRLPTLSTYISSSGGSIYWPERHQVFWGLGDIPPGGQDWLIFTVQYQWSIPSYQEDNVATLLVADNYNNGLLDMTPYETYTPPAATETGPLTFAEWEAKLTTIPDLNTLYTQAVADGFVWGTADLVRLNNGDLIAQAMMLHTEQRVVRILYGDANHPYAATFWPGEYTAEDVNGGVHWNLLSNVRGFFGDWAVIARIVAEQTESSSNACLGAGCCLSNCLGKVALTAVAGKMSGAISKAITAYDCAKAYRTKTPEDWSKCAGEINEGLIKVNQIPVLSELIGITECLSKCAGDPNSNDCTDDLITCEPDWTNLYDWLSIPSKTIWRCQGGCYSNKPEYLPCAFGDCCMPGVGCVSGGAGGSNCKSATFVPAKDPNAIYGPVGDLFPGQPATYTITYENEGVGRAYGVYVVNPLPEVFDARTLTFTHNSGTYLPESREIMWWIGELGPKGAADSEGTITYTVTLTRGLPSGTAIANQAVVYFPSVPEETPTNSWVNLVAPLVATPQNLTTDYMAPLFLILSGREISGLPLTYEIIEQPRGGVLTGTLPNLTYTPVENFTGVDGFAFQVSNGITTSRPAQVYVTVTPAGDVTSPQVLWTNPATAATDVATSTTPVFTDTLGPAYAPALLIGVSEPLNATTVSTTTITLTRDGALIPTSVRFDGGANQIILLPRAAISPGRYTVAVSNGITDLAGNSLKAYSWSFSTAGDTTPPYTIYLPLILRKR
ncbi:MAG: Ig-like domain-containing protein, partial [Anaerolineae bacterium]|nr:Ig-like domain-containing protein [Anaerolineae bacterium]